MVKTILQSQETKHNSSLPNFSPTNIIPINCVGNGKSTNSLNLFCTWESKSIPYVLTGQFFTLNTEDTLTFERTNGVVNNSAEFITGLFRLAKDVAAYTSQ